MAAHTYFRIRGGANGIMGSRYNHYFDGTCLALNSAVTCYVSL